MTICTLIGIWCALNGPARVIDGATLAIGSTHVRLAGIDAEEMFEPNGFAAKVALERLVAGRIVECKDTGHKSYGRVVAECAAQLRCQNCGQMDLGGALVREGYALDCARYSGGKYRLLEPAGIRTKLKQKPYCK